MYPILAIQAAPGEIISGGLFFGRQFAMELYCRQTLVDLAIQRLRVQCPHSSVRFCPVLLG